ncbi:MULTISPECIES: phosphate ABC transporter permease PstA [unclassified Pseudofrankia]|uniref:phosphate ABC transporter permease PstA n=1 Tax=unclassified Pseudofrankia TaxID=2994372 RepID=UPI0008D9E613|nr:MULTISPECIES: phosphate ABC transporter permease PstA [unclassified Pseudofrankia]MDT3441728.1 phosphate ABC transporter permease PstA [Pseudofrankia sp. BMG5.37]OHV47046.1 phosphate ABC transporter, permease protein PstA [Pseudofrankia sp. BMG5.36]
MSTLTAAPEGAPVTDKLRLHGNKLPAFALPVIAVVSVGVSLLLYFATPMDSEIQILLLSLLLFAAGQTIASSLIEGGRRARDRFATTLLIGAFLLAMVPLVAVLVTVISKGAARFDYDFFTHSMRGVSARDHGGGAYAAIIGTLEQIALASLIAVPFGVLVSIYLVEYGRGRISRTISFFVDVLTGLPSIIAGLFIYAFYLIVLGAPQTGFAGSLALIILMIPTVVRSSEEMLKLVPNELREASFALGVERWRTILKVVIPTALPGIVTGVMLAIARVAGETAPLLLTIFGNDSINNDPFSGHQSALPLYIFTEAQKPQSWAVDRAWSAALTLIIIVMLLNLIARFIARRTKV